MRSGRYRHRLRVDSIPDDEFARTGPHQTGVSSPDRQGVSWDKVKAEVKIDDLDNEILMELIEDGTKSKAALARKLTVTEATIRKRIQRLEQNEIMKIIALDNPVKIGLMVVAFLIQIRPGQVMAAAQKLAQYENIQYLATTTGRYDLLAWAVFPDRESVSNFVQEQIPNLPGLILSDMEVHLELVKRALNWVVDNEYYELDRLNQAILKELVEDGAMSTAALARKLGADQATIRKRIGRLQKDGVMKITALTNPVKMGLMTVTFTFQIKPGLARAAAQELAQYSNIQYLAIITGKNELLAWAVFRNQRSLSRFIYEKIPQLPGLIRSETQIHLDILKRTHNWILEAEQ